MWGYSAELAIGAMMRINSQDYVRILLLTLHKLFRTLIIISSTLLNAGLNDRVGGRFK